MSHYRKHKNQKLYSAHTANSKASNICDFCRLDNSSEQVIEIYKHFRIIRNIFPYDYWDSMQVLDHLMIVPIKHKDSLSDLSGEAAIEYVKLMSSFESKGYDVFARSPQSIVRSITHQHTHLIKTGGKRNKVLIHVLKPYITVTI